MKKYLFSAVLPLAAFFCFWAAPALAFTGLGTTSSPYIVNNCTDLQNINNSLSSYYILNGVIDCGSTSFTPIANTGIFTGTLDGRGYSINNLTIAGSTDVGLFGTTQNATIRNLTISNEAVSGVENIGGLIGYDIGGSTISKVGIVSTTLRASGPDIGGLIGTMYGNMISGVSYETINDTYVSGTMVGPQDLGGLIGSIADTANSLVTIDRSYFTGSTSGTFPGTDNIGGFVGSFYDENLNSLTISNSFVGASSIAAAATSSGFIGLLAGPAIGGLDFTNSYYDAMGTGGGVGCMFGDIGSGYEQLSTSGCTPVNIGGSDPSYFKNTTTTNPFPAWDFSNNWTTVPGNYPALYTVPTPYVFTSTSSLAVTEGGATSTFTIGLALPPTATVTVNLNPTSSLTYSTSSLVFTTSNWNTPQAVTVTGVDDHVGTTSHLGYITYLVTSTDSNYNLFGVATTTVTITDNPQPSIFYFNMFQNNYSGASSTLNGPVYARVPRDVSSSLYMQYSIDGSTWVSSTLSNAQDASNGYAALTTTTGTVLGISDPGGTIDTYFDWDVGHDLPNTSTLVYLRAIVDDGTQTSSPFENTTYPISVNTTLAAPGALSASSVSTSSVVFGFGAATTANNFGQYIIYYNTGTSTPSVASSSAFTSSTDPNLGSITFNGATSTLLTGLFPAATYTASIWAYNTSSFAVSSSPFTFYTLPTAPPPPLLFATSSATKLLLQLGTSVNDPSATYSICETGTSTPCLGSGYVQANGSLSTTTVWQSQSAWGTSPFLITGLTPSTSYQFAVEARSSQSATSSYTVSVATTTPTPGITYVPSLSLIEGNSIIDLFGSLLKTQPDATVTLYLAPDSTATTTSSTLVFTASNWNQGHPALFTTPLPDDSIYSGTRTGTIALSTVSLDPYYNNLSLTSVNVTVRDNDIAGVNADTSLAVNEGSSVNYNVALRSEPTSTVTLILNADSPLQLSTSAITFTSTTWNSPVSVTVTSPSDFVFGGTRTASITYTPSSTAYGYTMSDVPNYFFATTTVTITNSIAQSSGGGGGGGGGGSSGGWSYAPTVAATTTVMSAGAKAAALASAGAIVDGFAKNLAYGSTSSDVKKLQTFLIVQKYLAAGLNTGLFGPSTRTALEKFQCAQKIVCKGTGYGTFGTATRLAVNKLLASTAVIPPAAIVVTPSSTVSAVVSSTIVYKRSLAQGMTGQDVKNLQLFLNSHGFPIAKTGVGSPGKETTYFGAATKAAVKRFQTAHLKDIFGVKAKASAANGVLGTQTIAYVEKM